METSSVPVEFSHEVPLSHVMLLTVVMFTTTLVSVTIPLLHYGLWLALAVGLGITALTAAFIRYALMNAKFIYKMHFINQELILYRYGNGSQRINPSLIQNIVTLDAGDKPTSDPLFITRIDLQLTDQSKISLRRLSHQGWDSVIKWMHTNVDPQRAATPIAISGLQSLPARKKSLNLIIGLGATGIPISILCWFIYAPLRMTEALAVLSLVCFPLVWQMKKWIEGRVLVKDDPTNAKQGLIFLMFVWGPIISAPVIINGYFDTSKSIEYTAPLVDKRIRSTKNGRSYYVYVPNPRPGRFNLPFDRLESISVSQSAYQDLQIGRDKGTLWIKEGFLGVPWISKSEVQKVSLASMTEMTKFDEHIADRAPTSVRRETWPSGQTKFEEPLVGEKIHGLARYWYPNGQLKAEVPFKENQIHGHFTWYRPDGLAIGSFSFMNGQHHGPSVWYKGDRGRTEEIHEVYNLGQPTFFPAHKPDPVDRLILELRESP